MKQFSHATNFNNYKFQGKDSTDEIVIIIICFAGIDQLCPAVSPDATSIKLCIITFDLIELEIKQEDSDF